MSFYYEYELVKAASTLVNELFGLQPGETFVITADTQTDMRVVHSVAAAAHTAGAKPMVIITASPLGIGKAADPMLPVEALTAALLEADAWVEFNEQWLLYSTPYERATIENKKLRYSCLVGMTVDMLVRLIGRIDTALLSDFLHRVADMTQKAGRMRITSPAGNDLSFNLLGEERQVVCDDGIARTPGMHFLGGQIGFFPEFDSIHGRLAFDGTIFPPCGFLTEPVVLDVDKGVVQNFSGRQAGELQRWLASFDDPNMFRLAHGCYGFNPGARLDGNVIEDERVWGCTQWGLGYLSPLNAPPHGINAKSHCDGVCLNSSVWLDGVPITENGQVVHPDLKDMAERLRKAA